MVTMHHLVDCNKKPGAGFTKYLTIMPKLQSTYEGRLIYKTSYEERKVFLRFNSLAKL